MVVEKFSMPIGSETIAGMIASYGESIAKLPPQAVFLHGGGLGNKETALFVGDAVLRFANMLSIDFSGHGESTGQLRQGSLKKRVIEAEAAIQAHVPVLNLLIGASMGGYVALKLLSRPTIKVLILFCPALYDRKAFDVQFDQGFTEIIRTQESWRNTDVLENLRSFTGKLLLVIGDKDEVIPKDVVDLIMANAHNARSKELYIIPGCPHKIKDWMASHPSEWLELLGKMIEFIGRKY